MNNQIITLKDLEFAFDDAIEYLNDNYAYFLTNVLNIGSPEWSSEIPTACVAMSKDEKKGAEAANKFRFLFNPEFALSLTTEELSFVIAHETLHILLFHLTLSHNFDNKQMFNIAADAMINDYLTGAGFDQVEGTVTGEATVGFNCANTTVTEIYNLIENDPELQEKLGLGEDGEPQFFEIDSHEWIHNPDMIREFVKAMAGGGFTPDKLPDDLEEILNEAINEYEKTKMAGNGTGKEEFMKEQQVSLKWIELLEKVNPDIFHKPGAGPRPVSTFRVPRRKLMSMYPKIILPSSYTPDEGVMTRKSDKKPAIVLALDTSGSIGTDTSNKFVNLARSIPRDKVEVFACTFTSQYMPLDLDDPRWVGGGTCFTAIESFIRDNVLSENDGKYPQAVIVITDGYASFRPPIHPTKEQAEGWTWLLLNSQQKNESMSGLSSYGFKPENFDVLDGFISNSSSWQARSKV